MNKIVNSDLINSLSLPYKNRSNSISIYPYELFDNTTKEFVSKFKPDIQQINNGNLSIRKFKRKIGKNNFELFAQTANLCVNDMNTPQISSQYFTNNISDYTDILYPDNSKYNKIGKDILADIDNILKIKEDRVANRTKFVNKLKEPVLSGAKFLNNLKEKAPNKTAIVEKTRKIDSVKVVIFGNVIETQSQNRSQKIIKGQSR